MSSQIITPELHSIKKKRRTAVLVLFFLSLTGSALAFEVDWSRRQKQLPQTLPEKINTDETMASAPDTSTEVAQAPAAPAATYAGSGGSAGNVETESRGGFFSNLLEPAQAKQEIVILNTESGFVPRSVRVKRGISYTIHIVNVNEKQKNVSFILDAFSEFHSTFYGKMKSFELNPKQEGVFTFQCPETSIEGRLVVIGDGTPARALSSQDK